MKRSRSSNPAMTIGQAKSAASKRAATRSRSPNAGCSTRPRSALAISAGSSVSTTMALPYGRAHDAAGVFARFVPVGHGQPALGGEFEHRGAVRLHPATHEHATGHALGTKFREGGDGLVPAFVRAEAADLEREAR